MPRVIGTRWCVLWLCAVGFVAPVVAVYGQTAGAAPCGHAPIHLYDSVVPAVIYELTTSAEHKASYGDGACAWLIQASPGQVHRAEIAFYLGLGADRLIFYDGADTSAPLLATAVASSARSYLFSTQEYLLVLLEIDGFEKNGGIGLNITTYLAAPEFCTPMTTVNYTATPVLAVPDVFPPGTASYQPGVDCAWSFPLQGSDDYLSLTIYSISLQPGDYLSIYEGATPGGTLLAVRGNGSPDETFYSAPGSTGLYVTLNTPALPAENRFGYYGFQARVFGFPYTQFCQPYTTGVPGADWTHLYVVNNYLASYYPPGLVCEWLYTAPPGLTVVFYADSIYAGDPSDWLAAFDGDSTSAPLVFNSSVAGYITGQQYITTGQTMLIRWQAAGGPERVTFYGPHFRVLQGLETTQCDDSQIIVQPESYSYFGTPSQLYGNTVAAPGRTCRWLLASPLAHAIYGDIVQWYMTMNLVQMAEGDTLTIQSLDDYFNVTDTIVSYSGVPPYYPPPPYIAYVNQRINIPTYRALITYTTSAAVPAFTRGIYLYAANFLAPSHCSGVMSLASPPPTGTTFGEPVASSGYAFYVPDLSCAWSLDAGLGMLAKITLSWDLRPNMDYIYVYDGQDNTAPSLGVFTNSLNVAQQIWATQQYMYVEFQSGSEGNISSIGFSAAFTSEATGPPPHSYCPGQGLTTMMTGSPPYDVASGSTASLTTLQNFTRLTTCTYTFVRSDWSSKFIGFVIKIKALLLRDIEMYIYDSIDESGPILLRSTAAPGTYLDGYQATYDPMMSSSDSLMIKFTAGSIADLLGSYVYVTVEPAPMLPNDYGNTFPLQGTIGPLPTLTSFLSLYVSGGRSVNLKSSIQLSLLFDAGPTPNYILELGQYVCAGHFGSENPGQFWFKIYDGTNTSAPVLANETTRTWVQTTQRYSLLEFGTSADQALPSFGPVIYYRASATPVTFCQPTTVMRMFEEQYISVSDGNILTTSPLACTWLLTSRIGTVISARTFSNYLSGTDQLVIYDGDSAAAPVMATLAKGAVMPFLKTSGSTMFLEYQTDGTTGQAGAGFSVYVMAYIEPDPSQCYLSVDTLGTGSYTFGTDTRFVTASGGVYSSTQTIPIYPEPAHKTCTIELFIPFGILAQVYWDFYLPGGSVTILNNGLPLFQDSGRKILGSNVPVTDVCGNLSITATTGEYDEIAYWRVYVVGYFASDSPTYSIPQRCRHPDEVPCGQDAYMYPGSNDTIEGYAPCTYVYNMHLDNPNNYTFPNLRLVLGGIYLGYWGLTNPGQLILPALTFLARIDGPNPVNINQFDFSSLHDLFSFYIAGSTLPPVISFPSLRVAAAITLNYIDGTTALEFPVLDTVGTMQTYSMPVLASLSTPVVRFALGFNLQYVPLLSNFSLSSAELSNSITISYAPAREINLPNLRTDCVVYIGLNYMSLLEKFTMDNAKYVGAIDIENSPLLSSVSVASATYIYGILVFSNTHLTSFEALLVTSVGNIAVSSTPYLTSFSLPRVQYIATFSLSNSIIQTLSFPVLHYWMGFTSTQNYDLAVIDTCALQQTGPVVISNSPALSCQELFYLFNTTGSRVTAVAPDCDPNLLGTFGCRENLTLVVDVGACDYSLACIQAQIDAAYHDKGTHVVLPAGTYTGCSSGALNMRGKLITVSGAGADQTIIDCQGSGRAVDIISGETRAFELRDMTFMNGQATDGGLMQIGNASPTLVNIAFSGGRASGSGGAVSVSGGAAPLFVNSVFNGNVAANGGAMSVSNADVTLWNCSFSSNTAAEEGGALLITGAPGLPFIEMSTFSRNRAAQGGAIFTDSPLTITTSLLSDNTAAQFAGALAAVPTSATGTWVNITDSTLRGNGALTGGAVYGFSANLNVLRTTLRDNTARQDGGAVSALCSPSYKILRGISDTCAVYVNLASSHVLSNTAAGSGGGVFIKDSRLSATGTEWSANSAAQNGGGIYATSSLVTASGLTVAQNSAQRNGGGIYCEPYTGSCDVTACTFTSNSAGIAGGAAFLCTSSCPNVTSDGVTILGGNMPPVAASNTFTSNAVGVGGYGTSVATDPAQLTWLTEPSDSVVSGRSVSGQDAVAVQVTDTFGSVVTSSKSLLALSVEITETDGTAAAGMLVGGADTALAYKGIATFNGVTMVARYVNSTAATYSLRVVLSTTVYISKNVYVAPCGAGEGYDINAGPSIGVVCADCAAGTAGSDATGYLCLPCAAGSFASTARAASCGQCAAGSYAPNSGATDCVKCSGAAAGSTTCAEAIGNAILAPALGASAAVLLLIILGGVVLWRLARRKTMQKYYLDSDSTIRASGMEETPLMKSVKKIIGASSTVRAGGGAYADVYKARYENRWIALKVIKKDLLSDVNAQMEFRREAVALSRLVERRHRGIVELVFFLERNPMCIAMEFCNNGTLKHVLPNRTFSIEDKLRLAAEAAAAMTVVHACKIVHLDLKTDNLLLDDDLHIKLADFGISRLLDQPSSGTGPEAFASMAHANPVFASQNGMSSMAAMNGDPANRRQSYMAPSTTPMGSGQFGGSLGGGNGSAEHGSLGSQGPFMTINQGAFSPRGADEAFTPQYVDPLRILDSSLSDETYLRSTDVFSFGVVMWAIYSQHEPYAGISPEDLVSQLRANPGMRPPAIPGIHADYARVMQWCWHATPSQRPSFADALSALRGILHKEFKADLAEGYVVENGLGSSSLPASTPGGSSAAGGLFRTMATNLGSEFPTVQGDSGSSGGNGPSPNASFVAPALPPAPPPVGPPPALPLTQVSSVGPLPPTLPPPPPLLPQ